MHLAGSNKLSLFNNVKRSLLVIHSSLCTSLRSHVFEILCVCVCVLPLLVPTVVWYCSGSALGICWYLLLKCVAAVSLVRYFSDQDLVVHFAYVVPPWFLLGRHSSPHYEV